MRRETRKKFEFSKKEYGKLLKVQENEPPRPFTEPSPQTFGFSRIFPSQTLPAKEGEAGKTLPPTPPTIPGLCGETKPRVAFKVVPHTTYTDFFAFQTNRHFLLQHRAQRFPWMGDATIIMVTEPETAVGYLFWHGLARTL